MRPIGRVHFRARSKSSELARKRWAELKVRLDTVREHAPVEAGRNGVKSRDSFSAANSATRKGSRSYPGTPSPPARRLSGIPGLPHHWPLPSRRFGQRRGGVHCEEAQVIGQHKQPQPAGCQRLRAPNAETVTGYPALDADSGRPAADDSADGVDRQPAPWIAFDAAAPSNAVGS